MPSPQQGKVDEEEVSRRGAGPRIVPRQRATRTLARAAPDRGRESKVLPLQLFASQVAVRPGADVDQPWNLAKSANGE